MLRTLGALLLQGLYRDDIWDILDYRDYIGMIYGLYLDCRVYIGMI